MAPSRNDAAAQSTYRVDMAAPLEIDAEPEPPGIRLRLYGEVDLATVGRIGHKINECAAAGFKRVVVDLQGVTFLDCAGVHLALEAHAAARAAGWELVLIEARAPVQRVFELAGVHDRLPFIKAPTSPAATPGPRLVLPNDDTRWPGPTPTHPTLTTQTWRRQPEHRAPDPPRADASAPGGSAPTSEPRRSNEQ